MLSRSTQTSRSQYPSTRSLPCSPTSESGFRGASAASSSGQHSPSSSHWRQVRIASGSSSPPQHSTLASTLRPEMSVQLHRNRARCKDPRTEATLRGVERSSDRHVSQWAEQGLFPMDPHDGAIVLKRIFTLLDEESYPQKPSSLDSPSATGMKQKIRRIVGWMDIVRASITRIDCSGPDTLARFSQVFEDNFHVILRWLKFYMREASWLFTWESKDGDQFAPHAAVEVLYDLHRCINTDSLRELMHTSEEVADLLLSLWMWQDDNGTPIYLAYHSNRTEDDFVLCSIALLFSEFAWHPTSEIVMRKRISAFTHREHNQFMRCALSRMEQWASLRKAQLISLDDTNGFGTLMACIYAFLTVRGVAKALIKHRVAAHLLFLHGASGHTADPQLGIVVDILKSGYLEVILDDMFARHEVDPDTYPFYIDSEDPTNGNRNPLERLAALCIHRQVCYATCVAIEFDVSECRMQLLRSGWAAQFWAPFSDTVVMYKRLWDRVPVTRLPLCDNFKHDLTSRDALATPFTARQCSGCRCVVYCSSTCQQEDWELHKTECPSYRMCRIVFEIRACWEPHKKRMFFLLLLQQLLLNIVAGLPLLARCGTLSEDCCTLSFKLQAKPGGARQIMVPALVILDAREFPLAPQAHFVGEKDAPRTALEILQNRRSTPRKRHGTRFDAFLEDALGPIAMAAGGGQNIPDPDPGVHRTLAQCISRIGPFRVSTFGRFSTVRDAESISVTLLNGYMDIEPRDD
ncbi:hypothetical protein NMY22_g15242 [Coprinellus aureogranulatus]|nr:hypothetical protein NMY22_g15242 [Coprinellus aureogranulatus]